jgi:hypothetical protein
MGGSLYPPGPLTQAANAGNRASGAPGIPWQIRALWHGEQAYVRSMGILPMSITGVSPAAAGPRWLMLGNPRVPPPSSDQTPCTLVSAQVLRNPRFWRCLHLRAAASSPKDPFDFAQGRLWGWSYLCPQRAPESPGSPMCGSSARLPGMALNSRETAIPKAFVPRRTGATAQRSSGPGWGGCHPE